MHFITQECGAYQLKTYDTYKNLEKKTYLCSGCEQEIKGTSNELVYHKETDLVYHIHDKEKGILRLVFELKNGKIRICAVALPPKLNLKRLIANTEIKSYSSGAKKIKERDDNKCQLCGNDDHRVLQVHHMVPRSNPFYVNFLKEDPINCITLCRNCHGIQHYILQNGDTKERQKAFTKMALINGWRESSICGNHWSNAAENKKWSHFR